MRSRPGIGEPGPTGSQLIAGRPMVASSDNCHGLGAQRPFDGSCEYRRKSPCGPAGKSPSNTFRPLLPATSSSVGQLKNPGTEMGLPERSRTTSSPSQLFGAAPRTFIMAFPCAFLNPRIVCASFPVSENSSTTGEVTGIATGVLHLKSAVIVVSNKPAA